MSIQGLFPIAKWDFQTESILAGLDAADRALLLANRQDQVYKKGDTVFREGSFPSGIFYIEKGKVKKFKIDDNRREQIIYVANTGELIGYHALLSQGRHPDSAAALEECILSFIPAEDFLKAIQQSPVLSQRLLKTLAHEFAVLANSLSLFSHKSVRERLALQLIVMREKYKDRFEPGMVVAIRLSREDLANLVGTARENVVRILAEFKKEGIISTKGSTILVNDVNRLIAIADYK